MAYRTLLNKVLPDSSYSRLRDAYWLLWDAWHGVETSHPVKISTVNVVGNNRSHAVDYAPGFARKILEELSIDHQQYGFVDFGSGKGKVLLEAAAYPFKSVEGVEFSSDLHKIAESNIRKYRGKWNCHTVRSNLADATEFVLPPIPLVLYFFNPFNGSVLASVIDNIRLSVTVCPRKFVIICAGELMVLDGFERLPKIQVLTRRKYYTAYCLPG